MNVATITRSLRLDKVYPCLPMEFKDWLKSERVKRKWNQPELAESAGTTKATIQRLEYGQRKPSRDMAEGLINALASTITDSKERAAFVRRGIIAAGFAPDNESSAPVIAAGMRVVVNLQDGGQRDGTLSEATIRAISELLEPIRAEQKEAVR